MDASCSRVSRESIRTVPNLSGDFDMTQQPLFHKSISDALRDVIRVCGGSKAVGLKLWPEKSAEAAAKLLSDCINDTRPERLTPEQLLLLARMGRDRGCHAVMQYFAREAGYADPVPIDPADQKAELQRQFVEASKHIAAIADRIERLSGPGLRGVA